MDEKKEDQDGSGKEESGGKTTTTTEGQSEMTAPQEEDPLKKAFQSAVLGNVADSELDTKEKVATDAHAMTARDDPPAAPQNEGAESGAGPDKAPPSDADDDAAPASTPGGASPTTPPTRALPPVVKAKSKNALQEREQTAMDENMRAEMPSSDTGVSSEETLTSQPGPPNGQAATPVKRKSTKRKKKKTKIKKHANQQLPPPPFYQFPFFGLLPQVQAQERRKRAKKKDKPSHGIGRTEDPAPPPIKIPTPAAASHDAAPAAAPPPKKIEAVKIQQKEDDNGYLNLADLQEQEKKLYGEEKKIGAPGEEYICLADANDAAGAGAPPSKESSASTSTSNSKEKPPSFVAAGAAATTAKSPSAAAAKSPLTKEEFQDAVLTPRVAAAAAAAARASPAHARTPLANNKNKHNVTNDASLSRKMRDKKAQMAAGGPRPGAPVNPRMLQQQQPAPATSVGPNRASKHRQATKEGADNNKIKPMVGQPTKRKTGPGIPARPPTATGAPSPMKGHPGYPNKKNCTKDEFQDAVLTPLNKNGHKGGGTRR